MSDKINKKPAKNKPSTKKPPKNPSVNNKRVNIRNPNDDREDWLPKKDPSS